VGFTSEFLTLKLDSEDTGNHGSRIDCGGDSDCFMAPELQNRLQDVEGGSAVPVRFG